MEEQGDTIMRRIDIEKYILNTYGSMAEYPWFKWPNYAVYRHNDNKKWFAVVMDISKRKLGIDDDTVVDVMNLKCGPLLNGTVVNKTDIFPAYHMNKENWISVILDGSVDCEKIKWLLDVSYNLTK